MAETADKGADTLDRLNKIYLAIISRYRDYIEEHENVTVAELPTLVTPKNGAIIEKIDAIKSSFGTYDYDKHFYDASIVAFTFVKDKIEDVVLPLQFWLVPEETLVFMMGDVFDKSVLLCSLLVGLGNPSSKVLVTVSDESRKIFVYYELKDSACMLDLADGPKRFRTKEEMIESLHIEDDTTAYEFNDNTYSDIS
jgi:hypothetical protein